MSPHKECPGYIRLIPQAVDEVSSPSELHTACKSLIRTVEQCLSDSTKDMLGSNAQLTKGFRCSCKESTVCSMVSLFVPKEENTSSALGTKAFATSSVSCV